MKAESFDKFATMITQISKDIQKIKSREMVRFGLRGAHVMCLFYLRQQEEGLTAAELSALSETDKGAISRTVAQLAQLGYVSCPENGDKRKYRAKITLTDPGKQITEELEGIIESCVEKAGEGLSNPERASLYKALSQIAGNLHTLVSQ